MSKNICIFPVDINGHHFEGWTDAGRQLGIDGNTIRARIRNGWPLEEAFGFKEHINKGINTSIFPIDINGYHFTSYKDAENQLGIKNSIICQRIYKGWTLEEAFGFKEHNIKSKNDLFPIDINGYHFESFSDASRQLGIPYIRIVKRVEYGWPLEEAFGLKEHNYNFQYESIFPIDINGYHFESCKDASLQLGIEYVTMFGRLIKSWPLEEVFGFKEHITLNNRSHQQFKYGLNPKEKLSNDLYLCFNPTTNTKEIYSYDDLIKLKED